MDLIISSSLTIPESELRWRFSRSSGPGGQHVNTSDSRVELSWSIADSGVLTEQQRERLLQRLGPRLVRGVLTVSSSEQRSQVRNRQVALGKLGDSVAAALQPDGPKRRATKPTKGSQRRRLEAKSRRSATKQHRQRPTAD
ncbi:alternative ribosome rescue aminoacyl-tRNA hydrolase ArfB [Glutamicibacter sp. MNS18]|uniref:alternative ribosome rescue aminoacyl-tRNA hydrolase ArfB n=1 Tax=Glutamicibacter sp. MNS18 TaxID=2989817 RepID=UPI0022359970|nr:alternative ribosome rescue aminoacyl-tRNA hydrolase ArfB [Glutamicibacter sp. MNS18]MCW4466757.1 alternative ribosome rescue aminoacyl-tRNA hydrolase ArfB [Glutamicibacter sp. MNS18]